MAKVIGVWRLVLMAVTALVATAAAVLVIGPWGWTSGIDVAHGPTVTGPVPVPSVEPGVLYTLPDGTRIPDPSVIGDDHTIRFDVTAEIRDDHSALITEDITQSFETYRHGIERNIPLHDDAGDHAIRSLVVATDAGTPDDVSLLEGSGFDGITVRIGDPDRTITGVHRYRLTYVLENVVVDPLEVPPGAGSSDVLVATLDGGTTRVTVPPPSTADRVALDAFSSWQQPVYGTTYVIHGPDGATAALCRQGSEFYRQRVCRHDARARWGDLRVRRSGAGLQRRHRAGRLAQGHVRPGRRRRARARHVAGAAARPGSLARRRGHRGRRRLHPPPAPVVPHPPGGRGDLRWSPGRHAVGARAELAPGRRPDRVRAPDEPPAGRAAATGEGRRRRSGAPHRVDRDRPGRLG